MGKELTKIINQKCKDCGKQVDVFVSVGCRIMAVRCPDCSLISLINTIETEQLTNYLKKKNWKEMSIEFPAIKMVAPHPQIFVFIPIDKDVIEYTLVMKYVLNTIAQYYNKIMDEILLEVLQEENFD